MSSQKNYEELAVQAEKAVAAIKDPELRRVAFEKIIDDLISGGANKKTSEKQPVYNKKILRIAEKTKKASGPQGYIQELIAEGFFDKPKTISDVRESLGDRGHHIPITHLSAPLQRLCRGKQLRRQKSGDKESRRTYTYSNW